MSDGKTRPNDLNLSVCERVLTWFAGGDQLRPDQWGNVYRAGDPWPMFTPDGDIKDAWDVVESMAIKMRDGAVPNPFWSNFVFNDLPRIITERPHDAPAEICRAALRSMEQPPTFEQVFAVFELTRRADR